ncbi:MAG: CRISPR-associated protein Cas5 [Aigarchaeota archaeon]|nr:CRISPR-associated protein Cas5 [Candidatus Geocrenenecus dongiae]
MKALTFIVRFLTAQYKEHMQKMTRRTYLIPPPSVVAGMFGAILGLKKEELYKFSDEILAGAELRFLGGRIITSARIFKIDRPPSAITSLLKRYYGGERNKDLIKIMQSLLTIKESEELYTPEYKFAIASLNGALMEDFMKRLKEYDFEYDVFGGNDYHFIEFIGDPKPAELEKSSEGYGYCRREDFEGIDTETFNIAWEMRGFGGELTPVIMPVTFLANIKEDFIQVYGAKIRLKSEREVVNDCESKIFVHKVKPFLTLRI